MTSASQTFVEVGKNVSVICENIENKVLRLSLQSLEQIPTGIWLWGVSK